MDGVACHPVADVGQRNTTGRASQHYGKLRYNRPKATAATTPQTCPAHKAATAGRDFREGCDDEKDVPRGAPFIPVGVRAFARPRSLATRSV